MPTTYNWIVASGSATWQAASFSPAFLPANGDTVYVNYGNADINAGLNQSAVTLLDLVFGPNFQGTVASAAGAPLQVGVSRNLINNSQSTNIAIDINTTTPAIDVQQTGLVNPLVFGNEAFRVQGGGAGCSMAIAGANTSVGIGTQTSTTAAQVDTWKINGGTLNIGQAVTWTNGYQTASAGVGGNTTGGVVTVLSAGTLIQQSGQNCSLITGGTGKIATAVITGSAILNNRATSGVSLDTISIGPGGSAIADFSQDPRALTITNAVIMAAGATLVAFSPGQINLAGPLPLKVTTQLCGIDAVNVRVGGPVIATFA